MTIFKPMLAGKADPATIRFPLHASPKLDGIRCMAMDGKPMSRSMKVLPNRILQTCFEQTARELHGLDGELIVGHPTHPEVYRNTVSEVMSDDKAFEFTYYVFDLWNADYTRSEDRLRQLGDRSNLPSWVKIVEQLWITNQQELDTYEIECLAMGYEGVMTRDPMGLYKQGRASSKSQELLKVKRYLDCEAKITGFKELMHNGNEAVTNELGRTARSSHQENKTGRNTLGALICEGIPGTPFTGIEFDVGNGPGLDDAMRAHIWANREKLLGTLVKFKYFPVGMKEKPRHPGYLGLRSLLDIDTAA